LSANRVRDVHVILSGALGLAARWGWIPFNPALMVRPAGGKGKSRPVPTPEQVRELFQALADEPDFAVFLRLSTTAGMRPSEVCALRWRDVDLDAATVSINGSIVTAKSLPEKYARKDDPKSVHSERLLALDLATVELLRAYQALCEQLAEQFNGRLSPQAYVFTRTPDGRTLGVRTQSANGSRPSCAASGTTTRCMGFGTSWRRSSAPSRRPARCGSGWATAALR
jgi:integrase